MIADETVASAAMDFRVIPRQRALDFSRMKCAASPNRVCDALPSQRARETDCPAAHVMRCQSDGPEKLPTIAERLNFGHVLSRNAQATHMRSLNFSRMKCAIGRQGQPAREAVSPAKHIRYDIKEKSCSSNRAKPFGCVIDPVT